MTHPSPTGSNVPIVNQPKRISTEMSPAAVRRVWQLQDPTTRLGRVLVLLVLAISFRQWPLYSSNQNHNFLHGLADAGVGYLNSDWLARTADPTPVFSILVTMTIHALGESAFYFYQILLQGIYAYSILEIGSHAFRFSNLGTRYLSFAVLFAAFQSGMLARCLLALPDLPGLWRFFSLARPDSSLLASGVAEQYLLGSYFQPSAFGVFTTLSICLFLRQKPFSSIVCLAVAATLHTSCLLIAALLTLTHMTVIIATGKDYRKALLIGAAALALVMPIFMYVFMTFRPTDAGIADQAQRILVDYRIPHHTVVAQWFGRSAVIQIILVVSSICLVRRTTMLPLMLWPFLAATALTAVQVLTENKTLALLFPWRISALLVPIASCILLAGGVSAMSQACRIAIPTRWLAARPARPVVLIAGIAIPALAFVSGNVGIGARSWFGPTSIVGIFVGVGLVLAILTASWWQENNATVHDSGFSRAVRAAAVGALILFGYLGVRHTISLLNAPREGVTAATRYVAETYRPGNLYLIPPDMKSFRLAASVPVFVDFKSHPYKDREVIEWFDRVTLAKRFYDAGGEAACDLLRDMSDRYGITHVVVKRASSTGGCDLLHEIYRDADVVISNLKIAKTFSGSCQATVS